MKHKALILGSVLLGASVAIAPVQAHDTHDLLLPLSITGLLLMDHHYSSHHSHRHHYSSHHGYTHHQSGHRQHYQHPRSYSYGRAGGHKHRHNDGRGRGHR